MKVFNENELLRDHTLMLQAAISHSSQTWLWAWVNTQAELPEDMMALVEFQTLG